VILYNAADKKAPIIRIFCSFKFPLAEWNRFLEFYLEISGPINLQILLNESGSADLAIVLDSNILPFWVSAPPNRIIKLCREPVIRSFWTHRFTYHHDRYFSHIFMRGANPDVSRERELFPIIFAMSFPSKKVDADLLSIKRYKMSVISSTAEHLPGHRIRNEIISAVEEKFEFLRGHVYGRGRQKELLSKIDGLLEYQYSLAIENSRQLSYISEKFTDCILAGVVPVYWGAPNVRDFFPADSFVELESIKIQDMERRFQSLTSESYEASLPAIAEAQKLLATRYNLISLIESVLSEKSKPNKPKWTLLYGPNAVLSGIHVAVSISISKLPLSLRLRLRKVLARLVFGRLS